MQTLTGHADTAIGSALVEAGAIVLARVRVALVDVHLAAGARKTDRTIAAIRAGRVDTGAAVFAR